ncbi:MAG: hypothetical protein XXXJIFNMEKO3_01605 [Candidatus Erwinia impunctatus]|nr:hypothetical protein XXXJIFNMEKO_01605 [Culicoides impunctatus]
MSGNVDNEQNIKMIIPIMENIMKIHLDADYNSHRVFYPVYRFNGNLTAIELKTCFSHLSANVVIPQDILLPQLSMVQRSRLLQDEITCVKITMIFFLNKM